MVTRVAAKPTSYTFDSGARHGADMLYGHIFIDSDISGSSVTDVTGNGETCTLQGTSATEATDATHGKCLRSDGTNGATFDPSTAVDSVANYTAIALVKIEDNTNTSGTTEEIFSLEDTGSGQDSILIGWATSENILAQLDDADESVLPQITDAFNNNAGEWAMVAVVVDATADTQTVYALLDGDSLQSANTSSTTFTGTTATNNLQAYVTNWHGLLESAFFFDKAFTTAELEDFFINPYRELGVVVPKADGPTSTTLGASETYAIEGMANPVTATYNGISCTVDNSSFPNVDVTFPDYDDIVSTTTELNTSHNLVISDGTDSSTLSVTIAKKSGDFLVSYESSAPAGALAYNDPNVAFFDDYLVRDILGNITSVDSATNVSLSSGEYNYKYMYWDESAGSWTTSVTNTFLAAGAEGLVDDVVIDLVSDVIVDVIV